MSKLLKNLALLLGLTFVFALAAQAQAVTSGTIDFSVAVPAAFDLRSNGAATNLSGITVTTQTANSALGITLSVADASPNINNNTLTANVPIRLRSNRSYQLTALRAVQDTSSNQLFDSSDIGMSISFSPRSGARVNTLGSDSPATDWQTGGPNTVANLNGSGVQIATGDRISLQGNNAVLGGNATGTDNFVVGSLNFRIKRQYYTPTPTTPAPDGTPYQQQISIGISAP